MQSAPEYSNDVVSDVVDFLEQRRIAAESAGVPAAQILLDPGFGFGKTYKHNIALLQGLRRICKLGPVLIGLSRKRMLASMLGSDEADRTTASVIAAMQCVERGATLVRVHDVLPTADAIKVWLATATHQTGTDRQDNG